MSFIELDAATLGLGSIHVEVGQPGSAIEARLVSLGAYGGGPSSPAPAICRTIDLAFQQGYATGQITVGDGCATHAVLILVHGNPIDGQASLVGWSAQFTTGRLTNGTIRIGVNPEGNLTVPDSVPTSVTGEYQLGLRLGQADAISPACDCEGWGVADLLSSTSGDADLYYGGPHNLRLVDFTQSGDSALSTVDVAGRLRVAHAYNPSSSPYLYEITVSLTNLSTSADMLPVYRRVMDWDVEPTPFNEYVTIGVNGPLPHAFIFSSDDGFARANPLTPWTSLGSTGLFTDSGPRDHGAFFEFRFPRLGPGESKTFDLYYGAAPDEASALAALSAVGAQVYSLGEPSGAGGPDQGLPNTFMFGFRDVSGGPEGPLGPAGPANEGPATGEWPQGEVVPGVVRQETVSP